MYTIVQTIIYTAVRKMYFSTTVVHCNNIITSVHQIKHLAYCIQKLYCI